MKIRRVDWYPTDWLDGVAGMPPDERGVYDTIINLIYAHGSEDGAIEISERELALRCCCHWRNLRRILAALVRRVKIRKTGAELLHISCTRCAEELHKARTRVAQAEHAAAERWKTNGLADAAAMLSSNALRARARVTPDHHQPSNKESLSNGSADSEIQNSKKQQAAIVEPSFPRTRARKGRGAGWQPVAEIVRVAPPPDSSPVAASLRSHPADCDDWKPDRVQRCFQYAKRRLPPAECETACLGMMGEDPEHDSEWWLTHVEQLRAVEHRK